MKNKIRPIYSELQGYLTEAPETSSELMYDRPEFWNHHNSMIDELSGITGEDYSRYKITVNSVPWGERYRQAISIQTYRTKLGGLISRLHGTYFTDEQPPFSGMPSTVINQTQHQTQSISVILELQEKILSEISKHEKGSKERTFLEKVKDSLPSIKTGTEILSTVLKVGAELGLDSSHVLKLLHL